jgi:hypothetical protein
LTGRTKFHIFGVGALPFDFEKICATIYNLRILSRTCFDKNSARSGLLAFDNFNNYTKPIF